MADADKASEASTKVQEVAANIQQAAATRKRISGSKAESVARRYFEAIDQRDLDGAVSLWAPGGRDNVRGRVDVVAPEGVRAFLGELIDAVPDLSFEVVSTTTEGERCGVQWRMRGTFAGPGSLGGVAPNGSPIDLEGFDLVTVRDGLIASQRRVHGQHDDRPPDGHDAAAGLGRRTAHDACVQRQDQAHRRPHGRRGRAGRRGRVGRAGAARPLQRLLDRG